MGYSTLKNRDIINDSLEASAKIMVYSKWHSNGVFTLLQHETYSVFFERKTSLAGILLWLASKYGIIEKRVLDK